SSTANVTHCEPATLPGPASARATPSFRSRGGRCAGSKSRRHSHRPRTGCAGTRPGKRSHEKSEAGRANAPRPNNRSLAGRRMQMAEPIVFPGTVEWSGENPGISLKERSDGPFTALASFFRVVLSPHGRGHALVLAQSPQEASPPAERANVCLTDNEPLARYLVQNFVSHFGAWKALPALSALQYRKLDSVAAAGDPASSYSETVKAGDMIVTLTWSGLGKPFCFAL